MNLHLIDIIIVISYFLACIAVGVYFSRTISNVEHFTTLKNLSTPVLTCTLFCSSIGAGLFFGVTEKIWSLGIILLLQQLIQPLYWLISACLIAPNIEKFRDCVTVSDIAEKLYGTKARYITSILATVLSIGSIVMQLTALGYFLHYIFDIPELSGILIGFGIVVMYSVLGGIRTIICTEIFKFTIIVFMIPMICAIAVFKMGGMTPILEHLPKTHTSLDLSSHQLFQLITYAIFALVPSFDSEVVQRYLMAKNAKTLKHSFLINFGLSIIISLSLGAIAYFIKAYSPDINPKDIFPVFINEFVPIGLKGIMIVGLLSVIMSKAESSLSSLSIILTIDLIKTSFWKIKDAQKLTINKATILGAAILAIIICLLNNDSYLIIFLTIKSFWTPIVLIPFTLGFIGIKSNFRTFKISGLFVLFFHILSQIKYPNTPMTAYSFGLLGSAIGFLFSYSLEKSLKKNLLNLLQSYSQNITYFTTKLRLILSAELIAGTQNKSRYSEFGVLIMCSYFIYTVYMMFYPPNMTIPTIIFIGYFFCLIFLLREAIFPSNIVQLITEPFWYFLLTYSIAFTSNYIVLSSNGNDFWIINGVFMTLSLLLFVNTLKFMFINSIGVILAYAFKYFFGNPEHFSLASIYLAAYVYMVLLICSFFLFRRREAEQVAKTEALRVFGGAIAHEVKSPFAAIEMCTQTITELLSHNSSKVNNKEAVIRLEKDDYDFFMNTCNNLSNLSIKGISIVDNMLQKLRTSQAIKNHKEISIKHVIKKAIKEFKGSNRIALELDENFYFQGSFVNIKHVILNLLINTEKHAGKDAEILIKLSDNKVYYQDTGKGISPVDHENIFKGFYTTDSQNGHGIGLAFCRLLMEEIGGEITCESQKGQFTRFILNFNT